MTKPQITTLLGAPDDDQANMQRYRYHLGNMGRNPAMPAFDGYSLLIWFNPEEQVADTCISD